MIDNKVWSEPLLDSFAATLLGKEGFCPPHLHRLLSKSPNWALEQHEMIGNNDMLKESHSKRLGRSLAFENLCQTLISAALEDNKRTYSKGAVSNFETPAETLISVNSRTCFCYRPASFISLPLLSALSHRSYKSDPNQGIQAFGCR